MESLQTFLTNFSEVHRFLAYAGIFLFILIEGETILLLAGILARHGYLRFSVLFLIAFSAAILHDYLYWSIGRQLASRTNGKFLFFRLEKTKKFLESLQHKKRSGFYIFFSKFAWGLNRLILISSGFIRVPIKKLLTYSLPACLIWSTSLISIGYVFASETDILKKDLRTAALFLSGFIVVIIILQIFLRKVIRRIIENKNRVGIE